MTADARSSTRCVGCGFDPSEWTSQDFERTLLDADELIALWSDGATGSLMPAIDGLAAAARLPLGRHGEPAAAVHALWHSLVAIDALRRAEGDRAETQQGTVAQLNRSTGGVPKLPVARVDVDPHGVVGDVQATRLHHGRPWQALCLWSAEVIAGLVAEGHPISPGATGENVTIAGIDWASLRAGTILDIGSVRCQLSGPATPCAKNRRWFVGGEVQRMDHDQHPGSSRWYATVLRTGAISEGDPVVVEPDDGHVQTVGGPA
jgi:MOSC domain-containing protein YiiM